MLYNKACVCEYLGTNYVGWQRQKNGQSIQGLIEKVLSKVYSEDIKISGSGRTDAGVHALSQVFNYKSSKYIGNSSVIKALNSVLPNDISIYGIKDVDVRFHSWLHPVAKTYEYKIINKPYPPAFYEDKALWVRKPLDVDKLNEVLQQFIGEHDFASFCMTKTKKENTVRCINYISVDSDSEFINISLNANGFLHNMVRIIVGTAIDFVMNDRDSSEIIDIINCKDRRKAGKTAPAHALYQKEIFYKKDLVGLDGIDEVEIVL